MKHEITASFDNLYSEARDVMSDCFNSALNVLENSGLEYTAADVVALARNRHMEFRTSSDAVSMQKISDQLRELSYAISPGNDV